SVMRPAGPVPCTWVKSTPNSLARRRVEGAASTGRGAAGRDAGDAVAGGTVDAAAAASAGDGGCSPWAAGVWVTGAWAAGAGAASGGEPSSWAMVIKTAPTGTVAPSAPWSLTTVP